MKGSVGKLEWTACMEHLDAPAFQMAHKYTHNLIYEKMKAKQLMEKMQAIQETSWDLQGLSMWYLI